MTTLTERLEELAACVAAFRELGDLLDTLVIAALEHGASYSEVARILGFSRQRVHQLYADVVRRPS